ncbi:hypothetical protein DFH29DRAFT_981610 [Suillus ampliporus]|nr:hypothetical protein DFH29DRAFT_981610 [Suillus ampliporus]
MSCQYYLQGRCRYGAKCRLSHEIQGNTSAHPQQVERTESSHTVNRPPNYKGHRRRQNGQKNPGQPRAAEPQVQRTISQRPASENSGHVSVGPSRGSKGGGVCRAWKAGTCTRGAECRFLHSIEEFVELDVLHGQIETEANLAAQTRAAELAVRTRAVEVAEARAAEVAQARAAEIAIARAAEIAEARAAEVAKARAAEIAKARAAEVAKARAAEIAKARAAEIAKARATEIAIARAAEIAEARAAEIAKARAVAKARATEIAIARAAEIAEAPRAAEIAKARAAEIAKARAEVAKARAVEIAKEAAAKTVQSVVLGSIVTFGAGLELSHLITGFECCTLHIANLPPNVREEEINALFTARGLDRGRFHLVSVKPMPSGGKLSAEIITDAESGQALSLDLSGLEFRDQVLTLEVSGYNSPGSMSAATERDSDVLTISWRVPSVRYVAEYPVTVNATVKAQELNRRMCSGRRVKAEVNTMPPGRFLPNFHANSVKISNLSPTVSDEEIREFSNSDVVRRLRGGGFSEDIGHVITTLRDDIECISPGILRSLEPLLPTPSLDGIVFVRARFPTWDDAHAVHTRLLDHRIGNVSFLFRLPNPTQYSITISTEQFRAQKTLWDALIDGIKDKRACMLNVHQQGPVVRMRLSGSKKEAIGALKVRAESLIAGEKVEGWHMTLGYPNNKFARSVYDDTGALLRADWRRQVLKVYGEPKAVEQARDLIKAKLDQLSSMEYAKVLAKQSVRFFVERGIPELKETFGEDNVKFVISARRITISGGEDARHALERLIQDSLSGPQILPDPSGEQSCPICYDNISSPLRLGCGHVYCATCMRHFLTSALDSGQFPLTCMGDESQCNVPIPIPTIQQFLPPTSFNRLLEVVFNAHISRHPQEFKYCKTPDCNQIYRSTGPNTTIVGQCPSCFSNICTSCHEDVHDGMSCAEYKRTGRLAEEERQTEAWIAAQGGRVKKCPSCQALIEKIDGCNHMTCKLCQSHICWRCMGIFTVDTIYTHMRNVHGTIHDENPVQEQVNVHEQQRLFEFAAQQRQQEEQLRNWRLEQDRFEERRTREAVARQFTEAARQEATREAARREAAIGEEARRFRQRQLEDIARVRAQQDYHQQIRQRQLDDEARVRARREERPGWGCAIM